MRTHVVVDSPVGPLTVVAEGDALVGLYYHDQRHGPGQDLFGAPTEVGAGPAPFAVVAEQLTAYFAGERTSFELPLAPAGSPFQQRVWAALRRIPYAQTATYADLARDIGAPGSARAVGLANGRNPVGIVIPCHRVVGADGALRGHGGGVERKQRLLDLERRRAAPG